MEGGASAPLHVAGLSLAAQWPQQGPSKHAPHRRAHRQPPVPACLPACSLHVAAEVHAGPSFGQATIEPWDLHVGAQLQLLGRRMTLKKVRG